MTVEAWWTVAVLVWAVAALAWMGVAALAGRRARRLQVAQDQAIAMTRTRHPSHVTVPPEDRPDWPLWAAGYRQDAGGVWHAPDSGCGDDW